MMDVYLPLVLIGLPGAGKTSIGRKLALKRKLQFHDVDELAEIKLKQSISSYFASHGEKAFRELEASILAELLKKDRPVISTGGGIILSAVNRTLLKEKALCIYLDAEVDTLYERLKHDTRRPLLQVENPLQRLQELKAQRKAYYQECAHITIKINKQDSSAVVEEIVNQLEQAGNT